MRLPVYLGLLHGGERALAESFRQVADGHGDEPDVLSLCRTLADQCDRHESALGPIIDRYGEQPDDEPERFHAAALTETRTGGLGLLRDLQDVYLLATLVDMTWTLVKQAGQALRDDELLAVVAACEAETAVQLRWLSTRMKQAAPQALLVAS
ncbi:hypothetical protein [Naasia lichenicola]|uniref:Molybdopterin oxidoreductase n=1 Tax=Naasia lichenicola TaxID=2565933 RepID=A0A4S4FRV0_9MICO|nr:hypothetical protein [Naasia lichenicola]THG33021.1 hypothetical protein E6C64_01255 [Naasia lichenicola]